jgi:hypothetical protein
MSGVDDVDHPPAPVRATTTSPPPANWRDKRTAAAHEFSENVLAALTGSSKLSAERGDAMDYDLGDMARDVLAPDGRSRAVSTDVADTIEGLTPSLIEIFCGSDLERPPATPECE